MSEQNSGIRCAAIVLAAGGSTRLGRPKQLLRLNGENLVHRAARFAAEAGCAPVIAVLGCHAERIRSELDDLEVTIAINPDWQSGMGSSVHCGMKSLMEEDASSPKVLLLVCDQVLLSKEILRSLMEKSAETDSPITAATYAGRTGVPAVFCNQLYPDLLAIEGDQGARTLIQRYLQRTIAVDFPGGAVDIDTAEDIVSFQAASSGADLQPQ